MNLTGRFGSAFSEIVPVRQRHQSFGSKPRVVKTRLRSKGNQDEGDIIERWVGKIFGKSVLEDQTPGGLKRLDNPEMYTAVTDEFAEPLPEDSGDVAYYRQVLAKTQLEKTPLVAVFDTDTDGWGMERFGKGVYTMGATLLVLKLKNSPCIVGGYNPRGWIGLNEDRDSMAAFLFVWPDGDLKRRPIKLAKRGGPALSVMDYPGEGIRFAPDGLKCMIPGKERMATCRLGPYYEKMPDGSRSMFPGGEKTAEISRIVAYVSAQGPETYQLDGIVWKTGRA
jgi:hypothetical protein